MEGSWLAVRLGQMPASPFRTGVASKKNEGFKGTWINSRAKKSKSGLCAAITSLSGMFGLSFVVFPKWVLWVNTTLPRGSNGA
nr:hypothetical protein CFP56_41285 [Quercus suber]